jgi:transposase
MSELAQQFDLHANQIRQWRDQLLARAFGSEAQAKPQAPAIDVKTLPAKIGELTLVNCFLEGAVGKAGLLSARR